MYTTCIAAETVRYGQAAAGGNGMAITNGRPIAVETKLITVTSQSRSACVRSSAFQVACSTAAQSTNPATPSDIVSFQSGNRAAAQHR